MAKEKLFSEEPKEVKLRLIGRCSGDARLYNFPSASEVAALIVGDFDSSGLERDIVIECKSGQLKCINQLHPSYFSLQYPLLFPYGEDGYREDIPFHSDKGATGGRKKFSIREYFAYRLHGRDGDSKIILFSRRLFQQYVVDAYTMIEAARLTYIRLHQKQLRAGMYKGLQEVVLKGNYDASKVGKRVILPSTFTGGARYMIQNYQVAMAICRWIGYPDLFFTLTCNLKWPEVVRVVDECHLKAEDRPDVLCRIFKAKLDAMIRDIQKNKIFGEVKAVIYTVEFQKRGLPHAHILLFLASGFKSHSPEDIDRIISAEIPDENVDPEYFNAVKELMVHDPCGKDRPSSPCMVDGRCSKRYPKKFVEVTQNVIFSDSDNIDSVLQLESIAHSMFLGWIEANKKYSEARDLTYSQFPMKFVWKFDIREWTPRKRGLLNDDKEYIECIVESSGWSTASALRSLFVTLLTSGSMSRPEHVWDKCWSYLCEDALYRQRNILKHLGLILIENQLRSYGLAEIEKVLRTQGRSLLEFQMLPYPNTEYFQVSNNQLVHDELCYDTESLEAEFGELVVKLNDDQREVYTVIYEACLTRVGKMFFVYGYGGSGKTYIWRTLSANLRSKGLIVLNVASSGIASLLLLGGRTAHSRFAIPFNLNEDFVCNISQGSPLAEQVIKAQLIIWDEAPMMHKHCFEALDRSMRDIMKVVDSRRNEYPFGGKTIVFGGDFRQIFPVIPKGSRQDIVHATINSSYLWRHCVVLRLTRNMRLQGLDSTLEFERLRQFADWIAGIGDGKINEPNDGVVQIDIPREFLTENFSDPITVMVESIYSGYSNGYNDLSYFQERAILAPTLDVVKVVNEHMVSLNESATMTYLSSDVLCHTDQQLESLSDLHTPEFINNISISGLPNNTLNLKVETPVMMLRNIDSSIGLCNGTRLIITRLGNHVLEGEILSTENVRRKVLIPRMSLTPSDTRIPFRFERRQFPLMISYAMTINKSQGQSLSVVGLILKKPVFCHGQLYVALSRVKSSNGLKILICNDEIP